MKVFKQTLLITLLTLSSLAIGDDTIKVSSEGQNLFAEELSGSSQLCEKVKREVINSTASNSSGGPNISGQNKDESHKKFKKRAKAHSYFYERLIVAQKLGTIKGFNCKQVGTDFLNSLGRIAEAKENHVNKVNAVTFKDLLRSTNRDMVLTNVKTNSLHSEQQVIKSSNHSICGKNFVFNQGNFAETCTLLPKSQRTKALEAMENIAFFNSSVINELRGDSEKCSKCLSKFSDSSVNITVDNGKNEIYKNIDTKVNALKSSYEMQRLGSAIEKLGDLEAVRAGVSDETQKNICLNGESLKNKIEAKCKQSNISKELYEKRFALALNEVGIQGDDISIENFPSKLNESIRYRESKTCSNGARLSKDLFQRAKTSELYYDSDYTDAKAMKIVSAIIEKSRKKSGFCDDRDEVKSQGLINEIKKFDYVLNLNSSDLTSQDYNEFKESVGNGEKLNLSQVNFVALQIVKNADPLIAVILKDKKSLCNYIDKVEGQDITFKEFLVNGKNKEIQKMQKDIVASSDSGCSDAIDGLVSKICAEEINDQNVFGALSDNQAKKVIKMTLDETLGESPSNARKSKILALGDLRCRANDKGESIGGNDPLGILDALDGGDPLFNANDESDFLLSELKRKAKYSPGKKLFNDVSEKSFCENIDDKTYKQQLLSSVLYGTEIDKEEMNKVIANHPEDFDGYISDAIASRLAAGESMDDIKKSYSSTGKKLAGLGKTTESISRTPASLPQSSSSIAAVTSQGKEDVFSSIRNSESNKVNALDPNSKDYYNQMMYNDEEFREIAEEASEVKEIMEDEEALKEFLSKEKVSEVKEIDEQKSELESQIDSLRKQIEKMKSENQSLAAQTKAKELEDQIAEKEKTINSLNRERKSIVDNQQNSFKAAKANKVAQQLQPQQSSNQQSQSNFSSQGQEFSSNNQVRGVANTSNTLNSSSARFSSGAGGDYSSRIQVQVAPSGVSDIVSNTSADQIDILSVGGEVRFVKFAGKTQYIDMNELDEAVKKQIYAKLELSPKEAKGEKIVEEALTAEKELAIIAKTSQPRVSLKDLVKEFQVNKLKAAVKDGDTQTASYYYQKLK